MQTIKIPLDTDHVKKLQDGSVDTIVISKQENLQFPLKIILVEVNQNKKTRVPVGECIANSQADLNTPGGFDSISSYHLERACVDRYSHYKIFRGNNHIISELKVSDVKIG